MAAPNFDNRLSHQNQNPYFPPPPGVGAGARPNSSQASFQQYSNYPPPPNGYHQQHNYASSSTGSATGYPSYQRDPRFTGSPQAQQQQQQGGYYPQPTSNTNGSNGYAPSPVPSFGNQVAPFSDEKAHAQATHATNPGYVPYANTYGSYRGDNARYDRDRDNHERDSRSSGSDSRGERDKDRRGRHERKKSRNEKERDDDSGRGKSKSRNPLSGLTDDQRGLGASMLGGSAGALIGHKMGGTLGTVAGVLVGAIGAGKLEERHERKKAERQKKDAEWKDYYANERPKVGRKDSSRSHRSTRSKRDESSDEYDSESDRSRSRDRRRR